jgi:hypothetical protein
MNYPTRLNFIWVRGYELHFLQPKSESPARRFLKICVSESFGVCVCERNLCVASFAELIRVSYLSY